MIQRLSASRALVDGVLRGPTTVEWTDNTIVAVRDATSHDDVVPGVLSPGFIDAQVNGIGRDTVSNAECNWVRLGEALRAQGVTTWLPTVPTQPPAFYRDELKRVHENLKLTPRDLPEPVGLHFEGPLLGEKPGAHRSEWFTADDHLLAELVNSKMVTLAPEHPLSDDAIRRLRAAGVTVALGHSAADMETYERAVTAGATHATHLFNAMGGVDHVRPGLATFVLTDDRVTFSAIADLQHVHPLVLRLMWQAAGSRMSVVSDQVGNDGVLDEGSSVRLRGAVTGLDTAVRNLVQRCSVPLADALSMVSERPARLLGLNDRGMLRSGARADIVLLDDDLSVQIVVCAGFPWSVAGN